jgi:hypothetical protein
VHDEDFWGTAVSQRKRQLIVVSTPGDDLHLHCDVGVLRLESSDHLFHGLDGLAVRPGEAVPEINDDFVAGFFHAGRRAAARPRATTQPRRCPNEQQAYPAKAKR